jgi:hypothetical protein
MTTTPLEYLAPDWPPSLGVRVVSTLRSGGVSTGPHATLNLAMHVGDDPQHVAENRRRLVAELSLPHEPLWLEQVHGIDVVPNDGTLANPRADASVAVTKGRVCAVMTADCLPVVFVDRDATRCAVAHAGWRGLVGGVLEATIAAMGTAPGELRAWLGPAIGQDAFEVGPEVRDAFLARGAAFDAGFASNARGRFQADLYLLAKLALQVQGVREISGGGWCTASDPRRFFSYRRDLRTGRMATLAWLV